MRWQQAKDRLRESPLDWLAAVLLSWLIPLRIIPWPPITYRWSLVLWILPCLFLLPRFFIGTGGDSASRRAFYWTVAYIGLGGAVLDLVFGSYILTFKDGPYLAWIPAVKQPVPVEELIFYLTGGIAIILVYFWADAHWLQAYSHRRKSEVRSAEHPVIELSPQTVAVAALLFAAGVALRLYYSHGAHVVPTYYTFLVAVAFVPAMVLWRGASPFINSR